MANPDRPHGFAVIGSLSPYAARTREYNVAAANTILGKNDLVTATTAGVIDRSAASDVSIVGVVQQPVAASAGGQAQVCDDPLALVEAQTDDGTGASTAATDLFGNADFVVANASNGVSQMEIDQDSQDTTATLPLKLIGLYPVSDNAHGEFNRLICLINNHLYKSTGVAGLT